MASQTHSVETRKDPSSKRKPQPQALENRIFAPRWATLPDPMQLLSMADAEKTAPAQYPTQKSLSTELQAPEEAKIQHSDVAGESKGAEKTSQAGVNTSAGPRPEVPLIGKSDPQQAQLHRQNIFRDGELTDAGRLRSEWMNENVAAWIDDAINGS